MSDKVGYGNPPLHTRFRKGRSGNPRGRPKGTRNLKTDLLEELGETLMVREGTRQQRVSKQRAFIKSLTARAIKGEPAAASKLIDLYIRIFGLDDQGPGASLEPLSAEEREVLAAVESRLTKLLRITLPKLHGAGAPEDDDA